MLRLILLDEVEKLGPEGGQSMLVPLGVGRDAFPVAGPVFSVPFCQVIGVVIHLEAAQGYLERAAVFQIGMTRPASCRRSRSTRDK